MQYGSISVLSFQGVAFEQSHLTFLKMFSRL